MKKDKIYVTLSLYPKQIAKLSEMVAELERERSCRKSVYDSLIYNQKLTRAEADRRNGNLNASIVLMSFLKNEFLKKQNGEQGKLFDK